MSVYDQGFYDVIRPGIQSSAAVVVPLVMRHLQPTSVIDVGCGEGWWGAAFAAAGCRAVGVDGAYVTRHAPGLDTFVATDLEQPLPDLGRYDLAVCLEVAEHLSPARASSFVADLCALADLILFSAAIPGQGGAGHANEQPPDYWVSLFEGHDYAVSGALRWEVWGNPAVENWYQQNLLVAARITNEPGCGIDARWPDLFDTPLAEPWHVVHPVLFDARRPR